MSKFLPGSTKNRVIVDHGPVLHQIAAICRAAARGDLEPRASKAVDPVAEEAREALNTLLDVIDAYVRETTAAIQASSEGRFFRRLLLHSASNDSGFNPFFHYLSLRKNRHKLSA